jgi:hypothetical protein
MKTKLLSMLLGLLVLGYAHADETEKLLNEVAELELLGGSAVGIGGDPGRFYEISLQIKKSLKNDEIPKLLEHKNANVVALGLVLLAYDTDKNLKHLVALAKDKRQVTSYLACFTEELTLGQFAELLLSDLEARSMYIDALVPANSVKTLATHNAENAQQAGTEQPATRPQSKSEGGDKPQPEAEGRSR